MSSTDPLELCGTQLEQMGFADLLCSYTPQAQTRNLTPSTVPTSLLPLVSLFCFGHYVDESQLGSATVLALEELSQAGFATRKGSGSAWSLQDLVLQRIHGLWLLVEKPTPRRSLYFGTDSLVLAERVSLTEGSALDLCSGPGFQSLLLAARGLRVTGCEINERAVRLSVLNAHLNRMSDRIFPLRSDLYEELPRTEFDVVVANPPMVAVPRMVPYPFVGDGGPDGFAVIHRILEDLPSHLAPHGVAYTLGVAAAGDEWPLGLGVLRTSARRLGLRIRLTLTVEQDARSDSVWNRAIAATSLGFEDVAVTQESLAERTRQVAKGYADFGASRVDFFFMTITKESPGIVDILDVRAENSRGHVDWHVA